MGLNKWQRAAVYVAAVVVLAMLVYPPYTQSGRAWVFARPTYFTRAGGRWVARDSRIDVGRLAVQCLAVVVATGLVVAVLREAVWQKVCRVVAVLWETVNEVPARMRPTCLRQWIAVSVGFIALVGVAAYPPWRVRIGYPRKQWPEAKSWREEMRRLDWGSEQRARFPFIGEHGVVFGWFWGAPKQIQRDGRAFGVASFPAPSAHGGMLGAECGIVVIISCGAVYLLRRRRGDRHYPLTANRKSRRGGADHP